MLPWGFLQDPDLWVKVDGVPTRLSVGDVTVADDLKRAAAVQALVPITHTLYVDGSRVCARCETRSRYTAHAKLHSAIAKGNKRQCNIDAEGVRAS